MKKLIATLIFCLMLGANAFAQNDMAYSRDVNVQGEAWLALQPDSVKITVLFEENGTNPAAVSQSLDNKILNLNKALSAKDKAVTIRSRGRSFEGADGPGMPVTPNAVIHATEHLAVETSSLSLAPTIIEEALKAGASSIPETKYSVKNEATKRLEAIKEATTKAKEKALFTAQTLGIKLGKLISITVGEEDGGALLMQQRMQGENPTQYSDKEVRIIVSARFAVEEDGGQ